MLLALGFQLSSCFSAKTPSMSFSTKRRLAVMMNKGENSFEATGGKIASVNQVNRDQRSRIVRNIASVALPALAVCIVEPALTLVDMYFVGGGGAGRSVEKLAALSVNGAIFNIIAAATSPLCTGTTALVARALASTTSVSRDQPSRQMHRLKKIFVNGMFLGLLNGTLIFSLLVLFGRTILINGFGLSAELLQTANNYLLIRGAALPFALATYVVIGFSLGIQTSLVPAVSIALSSITNILGDFLLCRYFKMELSGAAIATAMATIISTITAAAMLFRSFLMTNIPDFTDDSKAISLDRKVLKQFFSTSVLLLLGTCANTLTYSFGSRIAAVASSHVTEHMAAHQVVMQLWWFLSYFSSPLSLAAQAILPKLTLTTATDPDREKEAKVTRNMFFVIAAGVASLCTLLVAGALKFTPTIFTSDAIVQTLLPSTFFPAVLSMFIICITTMLDGLFIGIDAIPSYIQASILSSSAAWLYYSFVSIPNKLGVVGAWRGLLVFSIVRMSIYLAKWKKVWSMRGNA